MTGYEMRHRNGHQEKQTMLAFLVGFGSLGLLTLLSFQQMSTPALRALFILPIWIGTRIGGRVAGLVLVGFATLANVWIDSSAGSSPLGGLIWLAVFSLFMLLGAEMDDALGRNVRLATHDSLTGLLNRRGLETEAPRLIHRAVRDGRSVCVAMVDCDRFKRINDGFGHRAGDDTLRFLAETLRNNTRPSDVISRLGGDEFVLVLGSADFAEAERVMARIDRTFNDEMAKRGFDATLSIGIAQSSQHVHDLRNLLAIADEAMYLRKRSKGSSTLAS